MWRPLDGEAIPIRVQLEMIADRLPEMGGDCSGIVGKTHRKIRRYISNEGREFEGLLREVTRENDPNTIQRDKLVSVKNL